MSRSLHALHVGNFKAFAATQRIPLKPITLVFGPNSAGKSSFIHSLALAHEAQFGREKRGRARLDVHHTEVGGNAIDLGGYRQFVHRGQMNKHVVWGAELHISELGDEAKYRNLAQLLASVESLRLNISIGIELDNLDKPKVGAKPRVEAIELFTDGESLLRMSRRRGEASEDSSDFLRVDTLATTNEVFAKVMAAIIEINTTSTELKEEDLVAGKAAIDEIVPQLRVRIDSFLPSAVERRAEDVSESVATPGLFPVSKGNRLDDIASAVKFVFPRTLNDLVQGLSELFARELDRLQYLGPLRSFPARHLAFSENEDSNWYAGGGYAWDVVRHDDAVRDAVNGWLGSAHMRTPYRLEVRRLVDTQNVRSSIESGLDHFLHGDLGSETIKNLLEGKGTYYEKSIEFFNARNEIMAEQVARIVSEWRAEYRSLRTEQEISSLIERIRIDVNQQLLQAYDSGVYNFEIYDDDAHRDDEGLIWESYQSEISNSFMHRVENSDAQLLNDLVLMDIRKSTPVTHRDVGIGISQVLPVLVMAYASRDKLLAMEQPEIHLHPALQAELADVFVESALGNRKNTFILETHSEHLILRLLRRIRETTDGSLPAGSIPLRPEDVCVLYIDPQGDSSNVVELPIAPDGDFSRQWPDGFFTDREKELF